MLLHPEPGTVGTGLAEHWGKAVCSRATQEGWMVLGEGLPAGREQLGP